MTAPISVVLVEDHALTRAGLRTALETGGEVRVIGEAGDGIEGEATIIRLEPAVAIVDIGLPGKDGIALTRSIKSTALTTRIVILTMHELDVLRLIADGSGNAEISERLFIGLGTVKGHIRDILEKLSASDRTQAAIAAYRRGLLS